MTSREPFHITGVPQDPKIIPNWDMMFADLLGDVRKCGDKTREFVTCGICLSHLPNFSEDEMMEVARDYEIKIVYEACDKHGDDYGE